MRGENEREESPLRGCYARESAGGEACPCGGGWAWGESEGDLTCLTRAVINRVGCVDMGHD